MLTSPLKPVEPGVAASDESDGSSLATSIEKGPPAQKRPRTPVAADDPRIERVFEIRRLPREPNATNGTVGGENEEDDDSDGSGSVGTHLPDKPTRSWGFGKKLPVKVKGGLKCGSGKGRVICDDHPHDARPSTPTDSSEDDRYEDDDGFPEINRKGKMLKMQISHTPRLDFAELRFEHLGGPVWEILTGIEARTKFTNSELRHEGMLRLALRLVGVDGS